MNTLLEHRLNNLTATEFDEIRANYEYHYGYTPENMSDLCDMLENAECTFDEALELHPGLEVDDYLFWWRG